MLFALCSRLGIMSRDKNKKPPIPADFPWPDELGPHLHWTGGAAKPRAWKA